MAKLHMTKVEEEETVNGWSVEDAPLDMWHAYSKYKP